MQIPNVLRMLGINEESISELGEAAKAQLEPLAIGLIARLEPAKESIRAVVILFQQKLDRIEETQAKQQIMLEHLYALATCDLKVADPTKTGERLITNGNRHTGNTDTVDDFERGTVDDFELRNWQNPHAGRE